MAEAKLENKSVPNGTYDIDDNGNLTGAGLPDGKLEIDMSGTKPTSGKVTISNGGVSKGGTTMTVGGYDVKYNQEKNKYEAAEKGTSSTEVLCKANTTKATALVWTGNANPANESSYTREEVGLLASEATSKYDVGVTYTCELGDGEENIFYVLESSGDNVSLIAGMNLGTTVAWITDEDWKESGGVVTEAMKKDGGACQKSGICITNEYGPITANKILKERTLTWIKLDESQITLPNGQQIAATVGDTTWTDSNETQIELPTWLSSHTKYTAGTYGYWTSSPRTSYAGGVIYAWLVNPSHTLSTNIEIRSSDGYGIRPVITIPKSQLG